jgi:transposase
MKIDMTIENIDVRKTLDEAKKLLGSEKNITPAFKSVIELLFLLITLLCERLTKNSSNSSKPPSTDPNRNKNKGTTKNKENQKKPGGQNGHEGASLSPVKNPDKIVNIKIKRHTLPKGTTFKDAGFEARQVINIKFTRTVTEYRAQILEDETGKRYTANFPSFLTQPVQYGASVKSHSVYMSQFQLIPYQRIQDYFTNELKLSISAGTLFNFNKDAYNRLAEFEKISKRELTASKRVNSDETGINIGGKRLWLHTACNDLWTHFFPHEKRGTEAMDAIGIIPEFKGVLCHDHFKPYYTYTACSHSLCNAHHLRELQAVVDNNGHTWAKNMQDFLNETNKAVTEAGGFVDKETADTYRKQYQNILLAGDEESPAPVPDPTIKKRGPPKKEKHRNLLERLRSYEDDVLRFMENDGVPFTNNQGENDLRMTKVQQKISGCFRSWEGAKIFCRVRGYLLTCQKHGVTATEALDILFTGKLPQFCYQPD